MPALIIVILSYSAYLRKDLATLKLQTYMAIHSKVEQQKELARELPFIPGDFVQTRTTTENSLESSGSEDEFDQEEYHTRIVEKRETEKQEFPEEQEFPEKQEFSEKQDFSEKQEKASMFSKVGPPEPPKGGKTTIRFNKANKP